MLRKILEKYQIVLASQSPRRKELLGRLHLPFEIIPARGEEQVHADRPENVVLELARQKADEVYLRKHDNKSCDQRHLLVIGADTIVVYQNQILGKPRSREHAYEMLHMLSGTAHQVYTGICIVLDSRNGEVIRHQFYEKTEVVFAALMDEEIIHYIKSGDPFDKAGAYGIQGDFAVYVREISGDYNNVVGLPIARLYQELKRIISENL